MSLLGLPNELIQSIAHHVPADRDVACLARVSRRFYALLNIYLYRRNHAAEEGLKSEVLYWAATHARMATLLRAEALGIPIRAPSLLAGGSEHGHLSIVEFLLPRVRRERAKPSENALVMAYNRGHLDVFRYLVDNSADLDALGDRGMSALHVAAHAGDVPNMELLLDRGADVNRLGDFGWTAAHNACEEGNTAALELLLERGADFEVADQGMDTPLHIAAWSGCLEAVKLLLENGADPNLRNEDGWTPALVAIESCCHTEAVARYLTEITEG